MKAERHNPAGFRERGGAVNLRDTGKKLLSRRESFSQRIGLTQSIQVLTPYVHDPDTSERLTMQPWWPGIAVIDASLDTRATFSDSPRLGFRAGGHKRSEVWAKKEHRGNSSKFGKLPLLLKQET